MADQLQAQIEICKMYLNNKSDLDEGVKFILCHAIQELNYQIGQLNHTCRFCDRHKEVVNCGTGKCKTCRACLFFKTFNKPGNPWD